MPPWLIPYGEGSAYPIKTKKIFLTPVGQSLAAQHPIFHVAKMQHFFVTHNHQLLVIVSVTHPY